MPITTEPDRLLPMSQLAELLDTSVDTLYKWSRKGQPHFPRCTRLPNGQIRVRVRDLNAWLEGRSS